MTTPVPPASRRPVARTSAGRHLGLLVVAFGVTVVVTRLYLMLAGYPQVGGGTYHIAHALWGGLLLIIASLVPLVWSNRWVLPVTALCSGVGVGLFVDEVGKYITTANNYFFPLAAPIIYLVLLALLALARFVSRPRPQDARAQTYVALDELTDVADARVSDTTRAELLARLDDIGRSADRPDLADLAARLRPFVAGLEPAPAASGHTRTRALLDRARRVERAALPRWAHRLLLIVGSAVVGLLSMIGLAVILALYSTDPDVTIVIDDQTVPKGTRPPALWVSAAGETVVGVLLLTAAVLLVLRRDRAGTTVLRVGLLIGLAAVNVVLGYVSAELVVVVVLLELIGLALCLRYRTRFLTPSGPGAAGAAAPGLTAARRSLPATAP